MSNMNKSVLRVATFNIRFDTSITSNATKGEAPWNIRRVKIVDTILFHRIDLVGIQVKRAIMLNVVFWTFRIALFFFTIIK